MNTIGRLVLRYSIATLSFITALTPLATDARGGGHSVHSGYSRSSHSTPHASVRVRPYSVSSHYSKRAIGVKRDSEGRIARNAGAKRRFERQTGYPHGRPGYVVDHIVPLKRGGQDAPGNMQWQSKAAAKAKDKWE